MEDGQGKATEPTRAAAAYVAELTADLARIARQHELHTLGYLLEMAQMEAQQAAGKTAGSNSVKSEPRG